MASFFRSEEMSLCQMVLHKETAFDCLAELGCQGLVQFTNMTAGARTANLKFTNEVGRCSEMNRILQHLQTKIDECDIQPIYCPFAELPQTKDLNKLEVTLQKLDQEFTNVERNCVRLRDRKDVLLEKWHVLTKADEFFQGDHSTRSVLASFSDSLLVSLLHDEIHHTDRDQLIKLGFLTGSVPVARFASFELMLWRVSRGNFFMRHSDISVPLRDLRDVKNGNRLVRKKAFMIFFQGEAMRQKIFKVCGGFDAKLLECPESGKERTFRRKMLAKEFEDVKIVLNQTEEHRKRLLQFAVTDLCLWREKVKKIFLIYFTLNKLSAVEQLDNQKFLQAECWIPTADVDLVRKALYRGAQRASRNDVALMFPPILTEKFENNYEKTTSAPTYFRLNKFTRAFQNLIDSYGIATYQELNPAPYTVVTFPFLFGVMFGDVGHGLIIAIFGAWMVLKEPVLKRRRTMAVNANEIWNLLFAGRYIIMLMGVFSIYTGLIYNDFFSKGFNLLGSQWKVDYEESTVASNKLLQLDPSSPRFYLGEPYKFGMDPMWDASRENAIITYNSLKMKLSIIFGVTQMGFGLVLGAWNHLHGKNYADFLLICVPQILFLLCLFAYMVFLILYKWAMYGGFHQEPYHSACAPSILITFIDMVLMKDIAKVAEDGCNKFMFHGQSLLQTLLATTAFLCIPVILAGKPLLYMFNERKMKKAKGKDEEEVALIELMSCRKENDMEEPVSMDIKKCRKVMDLNELWIHHVILCIESVLGSVSHTASYLRLWALSLAHDQLSTVLWRMVLALPLTTNLGWLNGIFLYIAFWIWSVLTVAILVIMEGLSAFLHTLRLHWVEFQSKFYTGSGKQFAPFRFEDSS